MPNKTLDADLNIIQNTDLEITLLDGDLNIIQKLDDEPNDVGGLTAAELKARFDRAGNLIKSYLNDTLIPQLLSADATESARERHESARETAESARAAAEEVRLSAEDTRQAAETARVNAEAVRLSAETARSAAESARVNAEAARDRQYFTAEFAREGHYRTAEDTRDRQSAAAESAREERFSQTEAVRQEAERRRHDAESGRAAAESGRKSEEEGRAAAEEARAAAESARGVWEAYAPGRAYQSGNKVSYDGSSYLCKAACTGTAPTNAAFWQLIAARGLDGLGAAVPVVIPGGRLRGDVDGDGRITYADAAMVSDAVAGLVQLDETARLCADVTGDGNPDSKDVLRIKNIVSGTAEAPREDVLGNWTYDEGAGLFRLALASPSFSLDRAAVVFVAGLWPRDVFARAELAEGALVIYTRSLPAREAQALVLLNDGAGEAVLSVRTDEDPIPTEHVTLYASKWTAGGGGAYYYQRVNSIYAVSPEKQHLTANPYPLKNRAAYFDAGIYIVDGSGGTVQFRAKTLPAVDITLQLMVREL